MGCDFPLTAPFANTKPVLPGDFDKVMTQGLAAPFPERPPLQIQACIATQF